MLALVVALGGLPGTGAAAPAHCAGVGYDETYEVTARARRDVYRIGQTAVVDLFVTDSITGMPASDVRAGLVIEGRDKSSPVDVGKTDDEGHAVLDLRLRRSYVKAGWARALAAAWKPIITPLYCTSRYGYREYPRLFRIRG